MSVEIYKTVDNINSEFMNNIFKVKENNKLIREIFKLNLEIPGWNLITFETKSLNVHGPKISNSFLFISNHLKIYMYLKV